MFFGWLFGGFFFVVSLVKNSDFLSVKGSSMGVGLDWVGGGSVSLDWWVVGHTFVFDIGDVTVVVVSMVGHDLGTTIGKSHSVFAGDNTVGILSFFLVKVGARVFIADSVSVGERAGSDFVASVVGGRGGVVRGRRAGRGGEGRSHEGGGKNELKIKSNHSVYHFTILKKELASLAKMILFVAVS